jgi:hypothetical protein
MILTAPNDTNHGGRRFKKGESIEIPDSAAGDYIASGWIKADAPEKTKRPKSAKAKTAKQTDEAPSADEKESEGVQ